jgi:transposase-like protein
MARKNGAEKELRWREILNRQADSGLSVCKFCATEGISEASFYAWRKKLRQRDNDAPRLPKARRRTDASDNGGLFVPLQLVDTAATLEIIHPLGYRIQVSGDVNPVALRHVIEALDERGAR